jgi:hypothetical protein
MFFAIRELIWTLRDAWQAADLRGRLSEWWYVVHHQEVLS